MKKSLLIAAILLALAPVATAASIDTRGIPADVQGLIHIDGLQFSKSPLSTSLWNQSDWQTNEAFKTQFGFDPVKDITTATIGLAKPSAAPASTSPAIFVVMHGKFFPEKIITGAKQANARVTTEGKYTIIEGLDLNIPNQGLVKTVFSVIDSDTILLAQTKPDLAKVIAAYTGEAKSYTTPAALDKLRQQTATPLILGYLGSDITPAAFQDDMISMPKADSIYFSLAEDSQNLLARIYSDFASPDDAQQLKGTIQMLTGLMQMAAAKAGGSGKQAEQARMLQKLLSGLQVNLDGNTFAISLAYPVADLLRAIQTYTPKYPQAPAEN